MRAITAFLLVSVLHAHDVQAQQLQWALRAGGTGYETAHGIAVDPWGNMVLCGSFQGTADIDPGPGTQNIVSAGIDDIFIAKFSASGQLAWARQFGSDLFDLGQAVATDADGNIYATGYFSGTIDFDPGPAVLSRTAAGLYDCFIMKLEPNGDLVWMDQLSGAQFEYGSAIAVDAGGYAYVAGRFNSATDFDPGAGTTVLTPYGGYDAFVLKLDPNGAFAWVRQMGGSADDEANGIAVDASGSVTTGRFWGSADMDPGAATMSLISAGNYDVFVSKLDPSGTLAWAKQIGGDMEERGNGVVIDPLGNVLLTGAFQGTADMDPGAGTSNATSAGGFDVFVCKLNGMGEMAWAKQMGGFGHDLGFALGATEANVRITGSFEYGADMDPGAAMAYLYSAGEDDAFVVQLDTDGAYAWTTQVGDALDDRGVALALDASGNILTTGYFQGTADLDPGAGAVMLTSSGNYDVFVQKLSETSTGIESTSSVAFTIWPNPAHATVHIALASEMGPSTISLLDGQGRVVRSVERVADSLLAFPVEVSSGAYFIEVRNSAGRQLVPLMVE